MKVLPGNAPLCTLLQETRTCVIVHALLASDKAFQQVLEHEKVYLEALPSAAMYERSYMHRDQITQVAVAQATDFIITGSKDGHLKFWKKRAEGIEFVKHFRAHLGAVDGERP